MQTNLRTQSLQTSHHGDMSDNVNLNFMYSFCGMLPGRRKLSFDYSGEH